LMPFIFFDNTLLKWFKCVNVGHYETIVMPNSFQHPVVDPKTSLG